MKAGDASATAGEIARMIRVQAGDFDADFCIGELALRLFGREALAYGPPAQVEPAVHLGSRVYVRRDLDDGELTDAIGDAVASWWYRTQQIAASGSMIEELSQALIESGHEANAHPSGLRMRFDVA